MTKQDVRPMTCTSAAQSMFAAIQYTDKKDLSLAEVMGFTSHAFRININAENVDVAGPTGYEWRDIFPEGLRNLGFQTAYRGAPNFTPPTPNELSEAIELVQKSIDRGVPAIAWDLFIPEFGLLYGYDDDKQILMAKDFEKEGELDYEKLGRGQIGELFVLTIEDSIPIDKTSSLKGALEMILNHAHKRQHKHEKPPYQNGLAGYDAWIQAFSNRSVDPFGNAYNTLVVSDARRYAVDFLSGIVEDVQYEETVRHLASRSAAHYKKGKDSLEKLAGKFPFPDGGSPNEGVEAELAIQLLSEAKQAEQQGVELLEEMYDRLKN
ncbi:MAG TPA: hypothetical protein VFT51_01840 [Bacillales bacterium]|nr:hypothetical protein [Bacillales bacterium]